MCQDNKIRSFTDADTTYYDRVKEQRKRCEEVNRDDGTSTDPKGLKKGSLYSIESFMMIKT